MNDLGLEITFFYHQFPTTDRYDPTQYLPSISNFHLFKERKWREILTGH